MLARSRGQGASGVRDERGAGANDHAFGGARLAGAIPGLGKEVTKGVAKYGVRQIVAPGPWLKVAAKVAVGVGVAVVVSALVATSPIGWAALGTAMLAGGFTSYFGNLAVATIFGDTYSDQEGLFDFATGAIGALVPGAAAASANMAAAKAGLTQVSASTARNLNAFSALWGAEYTSATTAAKYGTGIAP